MATALRYLTVSLYRGFGMEMSPAWNSWGAPSCRRRNGQAGSGTALYETFPDGL